ncbi:hypothetical protein SK128_026514, partial [Halocaridina rubra]
LYLGEDEIESVMVHDEIETRVEAKYHVTAAHNGAEFTCHVISPATSGPITVNKAISVL